MVIVSFIGCDGVGELPLSAGVSETGPAVHSWRHDLPLLLLSRAGSGESGKEHKLGDSTAI